MLKHFYGNWPEIFGFLLKWDEFHNNMEYYRFICEHVDLCSDT